MTFKPRIWQPIAIALSGINLAAVGAAATAGEGIHAGAHAVVALLFGLWAQHMQARRGALPPTLGQERLDLLDADLGELRRELTETQERLDFAERLLAQGAEARRVGSEH